MPPELPVSSSMLRYRAFQECSCGLKGCRRDSSSSSLMFCSGSSGSNRKWVKHLVELFEERDSGARWMVPVDSPQARRECTSPSKRKSRPQHATSLRDMSEKLFQWLMS